MSALNELRELDAYLEGMEDIDSNGGPNTAMRVRQVLAEARPAVAELIDALQRIERITAPGESDPAQAFNMLAKIDCIATAALARVGGAA